MANAIVFTDGSGLAKPGPAGVAYVAQVDGGIPVEGSRSLPSATSQQAEILAAAYGLDQLDPCSNVVLFSDSEYVVKGITEWMPAWQARGWRTSAGKPVKNQAHWQRLLTAIEKHGSVEFRWLRGHDGAEHNERCDLLAGAARLELVYEQKGLVYEMGDELPYRQRAKDG